MSVPRWSVGLVAVLTLACSRSAPEPPGVGPAPIEDVTGTERLGWTQAASDAVELATFRYAVYVDGVRGELAGVSCRPAPSSPDFDCSAPLPAMSAGVHTLELAAFTEDPGLLESARSAPLRVNRTSAATVLAPALPLPPQAGPEPEPVAAWPTGMTISTVAGQRLRVDRIAEGLVRPTGIAFLPDGRTLVAEEPGRVRVLTSAGRMLPEPALTLARADETRLLALAADPGGAVYVIYTSASPVGPVFTLARFSEASNALFGPIVLADDIPASADAAAALGVGADGKLFAAFDDGGDPRRSGDFASPNGKILRLNRDGTTPDDQAGSSPMYSADLRSPRGFDWHPSSNVLWIADRVPDGPAWLSGVGPGSGSRRRGATLASYTLPVDTRPSAVAFHRGGSIPAFQNDLLIASDEGRHLLRVRFDPAAPTRAVETERLLQDAIGGIRVVAVGPDGTVYLATADAIATLRPGS